MKRTIIATLVICGALILTAVGQKSAASKSQAAETALGAAIHQEEAEGNLEAAIASYKKFLAQYGSNRPLAAKAQYHLGLAYEKLGNSEARTAYERVTREFADQKDVAADAGRRLSSLSVPTVPSQPGPRLVMAGDSVDLEASLSLDGRWMAMTDWQTDDGGLVVREMSTGQIKRLQSGTCRGSKNCTFADGPVFSPDARQVVYQWYDDSEIDGQAQLRVIANDVGAKPRVLVRNTELNLWPSAWSPDGKSILVTITKPDRTTQIGWVSVADGSIKAIKSLDWRAPRYVNISPDGRFISYSALATNPSKAPPAAPESAIRHIYGMAADGSGETELVKSASVNDGPVWTPDGTHVVFTSNLAVKTDLWAVPVRNGNATGSPAMVRRDVGDIQSVGMTRTGSYYYAQRKGGIEQVSIADLSAGGGIRIVESLVGINPSWSPDEKSIAFSRRSAAGGENYELVVHSIPSGEEQVYRKKFSDADNHMVGPARWLQGGNGLLILVYRDGIETGAWNLVDLKSGEFKEVVKRGASRTAIAAISPDNRTLYVASRDSASSSAANVWDRIVSIDIDTQQQRNVLLLSGTADILPKPGQIAIALSPDGRTLAIATINQKTKETRLARVDVDGSKYRELYGPYQVSTVNDRLAWTKDGRSILFSKSADRNNESQIMRIGAEGGKPDFTGLTIKNLSTFDPSPDGSRIAFSTTASGNTSNELSVIDNLPALLKISQ